MRIFGKESGYESFYKLKFKFQHQTRPTLHFSLNQFQIANVPIQNSALQLILSSFPRWYMGRLFGDDIVDDSVEVMVDYLVDD